MEDNEQLIAVREEVAAMMARARAAQQQIENYTQEQVDELISAMVWAVAREDRSEEIARFTVDETRLGNYEGKYLKIHRKTRATLMDIIDDKSVGVIEEDPARNIVKIAKPVGVIGALVALHQSRSHAGHQGHLRRQGPQCHHHRAAPARQADQQEDLRLHARGHRGDGRAGGPGAEHRRAVAGQDQ